MGIGEKIKHIRIQQNMTQKELGEKLGGIPQQQIGRWENGKANPKLSTIQKIAAALEVSLSDLINTAENMIETSASTLSGAAENISESIIDVSNGMQILSKDEQTIMSDYQKLNHTEKKEARKRVNELTEIPRYTQTEKNLPDK